MRFVDKQCNSGKGNRMSKILVVGNKRCSQIAKNRVLWGLKCEGDGEGGLNEDGYEVMDLVIPYGTLASKLRKKIKHFKKIVNNKIISLENI